MWFFLKVQWWWNPKIIPARQTSQAITPSVFHSLFKAGTPFWTGCPFGIISDWLDSSCCWYESSSIKLIEAANFFFWCTRSTIMEVIDNDSLDENEAVIISSSSTRIFLNIGSTNLHFIFQIICRLNVYSIEIGKS